MYTLKITHKYCFKKYLSLLGQENTCKHELGQQAIIKTQFGVWEECFPYFSIYHMMKKSSFRAGSYL